MAASLAAHLAYEDLAQEGVPETLLWTLYHRAVEARRPDAVLQDPKAIELVEKKGGKSGDWRRDE